MIPYRPGVAQRVGRDIALLFHDRGTRSVSVVSNTLRPHFTPEKDPVPILQEAGWAPGPVWTGRKSRPHRDSIPDSPARSQSLYRLSYGAHTSATTTTNTTTTTNITLTMDLFEAMLLFNLIIITITIPSSSHFIAAQE